MASLVKISILVIVSALLLLARKGSADVSNITDTLILKTVREFNDMCPYTDLCFTERKENFPFIPPSSRRRSMPCCQICSCEDTCGTSCCPDKSDSYVTAQHVLDHNQNMTRCLRLQYRAATWNSSLIATGYYTASFCPVGYLDDNVNIKCRRDYQDFDFTEDITNLVPVSDGNTIFKNKYCAICNGALLENLKYFDVEITCQKPAIFPAVRSFIEIRNGLENNEKCDLFFNPTTTQHVNDTCIPVIDRCNVSGQWAHHDSDTERACMSYTSLYQRLYKNVHCYLCNIGPLDSVPTICESSSSSSYNPNSFIALLDFRGLVVKASEATADPSVHCPTDYMYDAVKGKSAIMCLHKMPSWISLCVLISLILDDMLRLCGTFYINRIFLAHTGWNACRPLICQEFMFISEGTCKPLFLSLRDFYETVYDVIISVEPRAAFNNKYVLPGSVENMYYAIWYSVSNSLKTVQSKFSMCNIFGFAFLHQTIPELIADFIDNGRKYLVYSEIEQFAFRLQIHGEVGTDLNYELQNLNSMFTNYSQEPGLLPFIIRFRNITPELFDNAATMLGDYQSRGSTSLDRQLGRLRLDAVLHRALAAGFQHESSGRTIAPLYNSYPISFQSCEPIATYQLQPDCPKIQLFANEFNVTEEGILLNEGNIFMSNLELIFTINNSALVCYETYKASLNMQLSQDQSGTDSKMNPIIILTIISLGLSLTSLSISLIVYATLAPLRSLPGLNIIGLTTSLFVSHLLTLLNGIVKIRLRYLCVGFGILLHLSVLMSTLWMFVCTYHMSKVFLSRKPMNPSHTNKLRLFTRYCSFTVIVSVLFVVINIVVSVVRSNRATLGYDKIACYLDSTDMVLFTVAIPVGFVVVANIAMFTAVVVKLGTNSSMAGHRNLERNNIAIFAKLSTLTGIMGTFGFLYQFTNIEAFAYVSVVLNAGQGVFIMVAFVLNRRVWAMLKTHYKASFKRNSSETKTKLSNRKSPVEQGNQCRL